MTAGEHILQRIWQLLHEATTQGAGFTLGFLGTLGIEGEPRVRAIILRQFQESPERICFATNIHSEKVAEIRRSPQVALTGHDAERSVQLRIEGRASVVEDQTQRQRAWESLAPHSQQLYASTLVPGAPLSEELNDAVEDDGSAFERFAWVSIELEQLDWLDLSAEPHQRWQFTQQAGSWNGRRVVP